MKKITKHVTKETFYRRWEETVVGLKMHPNRMNVNRKHHL